MTSSTPAAEATTTTTTSTTTPIPPSVMWAQRNAVLYVSIVVECKDIEVKFTEDTMHFKGAGVKDNKLYEVTLNFLKKINPEQVTNNDTARCIQYKIVKAESGPYWTSLTTDKKKPHFLKVDFNKWVDEDAGSDFESMPDFDSNPNLMNYMDLANKGSGLMDKPKPGFDDIYDQSDSDDEDLPNLE